MSKAAKVVFFCVSIVAMAGFAGGSLLMADNRWTDGGLVILLSVFVIGFGFILRGRVLRGTRKSS